MMHRVILLSLLVLLVLLSSASAGRSNVETTREEILESRKRRSKQLDAMLQDATERLADHKSGTRMLVEKERVDLEKKINIYQRKLETMQGDLDEREIERIMKREELRNDRMKERRERRAEEL